MNLPTTLRQLWDVTGINPETSSGKENRVLGGIGLLLNYPLENGGVWATPLDSLMFARTGGDGTHYSLVLDNGELSDSSPVVMTVPASGDTLNLIVGSNLREFLALGCRFGYFMLENLVYGWKEAIAELASGEYPCYDDDGEDRALLAKLASTFHLSPWPDPERRLVELQKQYFQLLELDEEYTEMLSRFPNWWAK